MAQSETLQIVMGVRDRLSSGFASMTARSRVAFAGLASMIGTVGRAFTSLRVLIAGFWTRQVLRFFDKLGEVASPEIGARYKATIEQFGKSWDKALNRVADRLLPSVTEQLDGLAKWFEDNKESIAASIQAMFAPLILAGKVLTGMKDLAFVFRSGGQSPSGDAQRDLYALRREELARQGMRDWRLQQMQATGSIFVREPDDDSMRGIYNRASDQAYKEVYTDRIQKGELAIQVENELAAARSRTADATKEASAASLFATQLLIQTGDAFRYNFSGALSSVLLGTMKATTALREFARAMLESITRTATDSLASGLWSGLLGLFGGGGGGGTATVRRSWRGYPMPGHARGTVTDGPELAWIGDNPGGREAVIPMDDGRHVPVRIMGGGRGGTVNNYYINAIDSQSFATAFTRAERAHGMTRATMLRNANRDKGIRSKFRVR